VDAKELRLPFDKQVIVESHWTTPAEAKNQSLAASDFAGIFERLRAT